MDPRHPRIPGRGGARHSGRGDRLHDPRTAPLLGGSAATLRRNGVGVGDTVVSRGPEIPLDGAPVRSTTRAVHPGCDATCLTRRIRPVALRCGRCGYRHPWRRPGRQTPRRERGAALGAVSRGRTCVSAVRSGRSDRARKAMHRTGSAILRPIFKISPGHRLGARRGPRRDPDAWSISIAESVKRGRGDKDQFPSAERGLRNDFRRSLPTASGAGLRHADPLARGRFNVVFPPSALIGSGGGLGP